MDRILCAAVRYVHDQKYAGGPLNVPHGLVVCGRRHNDCFTVLEQIKGCTLDKISREDIGFLTAENRFVSRKEAYQIALAAGQITDSSMHDESNLILTSEDLYWGNDKE